jgi:NADH-quinone oxidoreductase subunit F
MFHRIEMGGGTDADLNMIADICSNMAGQTICAFADAVTGPALSSVRKFRAEFEEHVRLKRCPLKTSQPLHEGAHDSAASRAEKTAAH